jgi:hypothetical protein
LLRAFKDVFVLPDVELQFNSFNKFNSEIEFWVKSPSITWSDATARHHVVTPLREHLLRLEGQPEDSTSWCWANLPPMRVCLIDRDRFERWILSIAGLSTFRKLRPDTITFVGVSAAGPKKSRKSDLFTDASNIRQMLDDGMAKVWSFSAYVMFLLVCVCGVALFLCCTSLCKVPDPVQIPPVPDQLVQQQQQQQQIADRNALWPAQPGAMAFPWPAAAAGAGAGAGAGWGQRGLGPAFHAQARVNPLWGYATNLTILIV